MNLLISITLALLFLSTPLYAEQSASFVENAPSQELLIRLRSGGYVLYMRHGATDSSKPDRVPRVDLSDCSTQRPLTEEGLRLAVFLGKSLRKAGILVNEVVSSPLCRAKESARAAFGDGFQIIEQLMYTSNMTSEEKKPNLETTRRYLSAPVARGGNRVIVAHAPNLADLIGYFPTPEGTIAVFMPLGDKGFEYIASIHPDAWNRLLKH